MTLVQTSAGMKRDEVMGSTLRFICSVHPPRWVHQLAGEPTTCLNISEQYTKRSHHDVRLRRNLLGILAPPSSCHRPSGELSVINDHQKINKCTRRTPGGHLEDGSSCEADVNIRADEHSRTAGATNVVRFTDIFPIVLLDDLFAVQNHQTESTPTPVDNRILTFRERMGHA